MNLNELLNAAKFRFKMAQDKKKEKEMKQEYFDELYVRYKAEIEDIYNRGKAAVDDGFDFKDLAVLKDLIVEAKNILDDAQENLTLQEKKEFIVMLLMKIYDKHYEKLPWWAKLIPLKKYFVEKYVAKYVGKALDYLEKKGIVKSEDLPPEL